MGRRYTFQYTGRDPKEMHRRNQVPKAAGSAVGQHSIQPTRTCRSGLQPAYPERGIETCCSAPFSPCAPSSSRLFQYKPYSTKYAAWEQESQHAYLLRLLRSSIKGKLITGETGTDVAKLMQENPVFKHVGHLNNRRLLNESNSALDFGDKPVMVGAKTGPSRSGAFVVPQSTPSRLVVEYAECEPRFNGQGCYESSKLFEHGITAKDFHETLAQATETLRPLRGSATRTELYSLLVLGIGLLLVLTAGIVLGYLISYYITLAMCVVYIAFLVVFILCIRRRNARLLVHSHVALAILARCLNNRIYLRRKVLVRPGYLGKWLEFNMIPSHNQSTDS